MTLLTKSDQIIIRNLTPADLPQVAEIHCLSFPTSALTRLGSETVRRYYEWQMIGPHDLTATGAFIGEQMVAFCFAGTFNGAIIGFLRKNTLFLAWQAATHFWLLREELFRSRARRGAELFARLLNPSKRPVSRPNEPAKREYGILSIAVDPRQQGKGIGKVLMAENEKIARQRGYPSMGLNVATANQQAIGFYQSLGWEKTLSDEGDWKGKMRKYFIEVNTQVNTQ